MPTAAKPPLRDRIYQAWFAGLLVALAAAMAYYPLSWGLMDDAQTLASVKNEWQGLSLFELLRHYSVNVIFRPVYVAYLFLAYGTFSNSPKGLYFFVFLFVLLSLLPWVLILRRQLPQAGRCRLLLGFLFLLLACTPLYNLIVFLSLQEKFVIGFGGWACYALLAAEDVPGTGPTWWWTQSLGLLSFMLGVFGKPTTLAFAPWCLLSLIMDSTKKKLPRFVFTLLWITLCAACGSLFLRRSDSYTSRYSTSQSEFLQKLTHQPAMAYLFVALGLISLVLLYLDLKKPVDQADRPLSGLRSRSLWSISLLAYLAVLIPWGLATYLWAPAMVLASGCLILACEWFSRHWPATGRLYNQLGLPLLALAAAVVVFRVAIPRLSRQAEIGRVVSWLGTQWPAPAVEVFIQDPCLEAGTALQLYTGNVQRITLLHRGEEPPPTRKARWLITRDECPADSKHRDLFRHVLYQLPHWTIYADTGMAS